MEVGGRWEAVCNGKWIWMGNGDECGVGSLEALKGCREREDVEEGR